MSGRATRVQSARARANIMAEIYRRKAFRPGCSTDFGRSLDGCFENSDGWAVMLWFIRKLVDDPQLRQCVYRHHATQPEYWIHKAALAIAQHDWAAFRKVWADVYAKSVEGDSVRSPEWGETRTCVDRPTLDGVPGGDAGRLAPDVLPLFAGGAA